MVQKMEEEHNVIKIAIVGLDNAGKTTMLETLQKKYHIGDVLKPTKNIDRNIYRLFDQDLTIWDYGGQSEYRQNYLSKPERYLSMIKNLFYVIDIQDQNRFSEAIKYFGEIYNFLKELEEPPIISVFFHKDDPEIAQTAQIIERVNHLRNAIHNIAIEQEIGYFQTSCFDPMTVLSALSLPIIGTSKLYGELSTYFASISMEKNIEMMTAYIDDLFEVGSFRLYRPQQKALTDATVDFYNQFMELDIDEPVNHYKFKGYKFIILSGDLESAKYTLIMAYPDEVKEKSPAEADFTSIRKKTEEILQENQIQFY